jgi:MFS family permease
MPYSDTARKPDVSIKPAAPAPRTAPLALVVICVGYFLVILDATVVNVALPAIGRELHGGVAGLQWVVDAYTLSFAGLLLAGGTLAERAPWTCRGSCSPSPRSRWRPGRSCRPGGWAGRRCPSWPA